MKYEVRDYATNKYLFGAFSEYEDAINCVDELVDEEFQEDFFDIVMTLTDSDKNILIDKFTRDMRLFISDDCRIIDTYIVDGFFANEIFIRMLLVDKLHNYMLLSYTVAINCDLEIIDYEQNSVKYLA